MTCDQTDRLLDQYMDDELSASDHSGLEAHCAECCACMAKYRATREMKLLFTELAPEVDVPLTTQAAWRRAVRDEAGKGRAKRIYRFAAGIAAALVVAFGATFALRPHGATLNETAVPMAMEQSVALIETDGQSEDLDESIDTAVSRALPLNEVTMTVEDLDETCDYIADLVSEYEGELDLQRFEEGGVSCANLYIELPAENAAEFLTAASHYDRDGQAVEIGDAEGDRVELLLVLKEG